MYGMVVIEGLLAVMMVITTISNTEAGGHVMAWWSLKGSWQLCW